jgi:serine phosphatase RsbU (regulator of sigma subunit)/CHASE3 domain sensor protein
MLLRRRLQLLFVAILAGVVALGGAIAYVIRERDDAQVHERELSVALERVAQLGLAYSDQETGERGYVLTGESSFLEPFTTGERQAELVVGQLRTSTDSPAVRALLSEVVRAGSRWRLQAANPEIALRESGDAEAAAAAIASGTGKALFNETRTALGALGARLRVDEVAAVDRLDRLKATLSWLFAGIVAVAIAGAFAAAFLIRRWVTRPIDALGREVRRIRAGALDSPIQASGPPELAALAMDVDAMRGRIQQQLAESERSRLAVEQSAAVVLTLRSHLEPDVGRLPDGWTVAATLRAAEGVVAGDCYDLFALKGGRLALVVVDIAGHGATEGILALRAKEVLRTALSADQPPGEALETTAAQLGDMGSEVFLTAFVAVIETDDGGIRYANAGHPPALIVTGDGAVELGPTGPLVGLLSGHWATAEAVIGAGHNLCAYTDGLTETRNVDSEFFGAERLAALLDGARCDEAPAVVKRCIDEVELFSPDGLRDDATIVVLCRSQN